MRQIKFRAWDGSAMRYDVTGFEHGCDNEMQGVFIDGDYFWFSESTPSNTKELYFKADVMQFTGLHDANGVEIYEGDVVVSRYIINPGALISYQRNYAGFCIGIDWPLGEYYDRINNGLNLEVIGNIHESPELLEPQE